MSQSKQMTAQHTGRTCIAPRFSIVKELLIWNNAWQEYYRLQRLDADNLRDMGINEASRASITVAQIASRMRG